MPRIQDIILRGTRAAQPAANQVVVGAIYYVTDESVTERSTGSAWEDISDAASGGDHGALSGLTDDDHTQYPLVTDFEADRATIGTRWDDLTDGGETSLHSHAGVTAFTDSALDDASLTTPWFEVPGLGEGYITVNIDGGGSAITTGIKGDLYVPFSLVLTSVTMLADQASSSIVVDIWNDTVANHPPTDADSITASDPPTITNNISSQDNNISTWTTTINAGTVLRFNVDSATTITRLAMTLAYYRAIP